MRKWEQIWSPLIVHVLKHWFFLILVSLVLSDTEKMTILHHDWCQDLRFGLFPHCYKAKYYFATAKFKSPSLRPVEYFLWENKVQVLSESYSEQGLEGIFSSTTVQWNHYLWPDKYFISKIENGLLQGYDYLCNIVHNGFQIPVLFQLIHILENTKLKNRVRNASEFTAMLGKSKSVMPPFPSLNLLVYSFQPLELITFSQTKDPIIKVLFPAFVLVDPDQVISLTSFIRKCKVKAC